MNIIVKNMGGLRFYANEKWIALPFGKTPKGFQYALTNYGRVISYIDSPEKNGVFLKHSFIRGYPAVSFATNTTKSTFLVHRLVADHFLKKPSPNHQFVLHLNLNKEDNFANNLKWATAEEKYAHAAIKRKETEKGNYKLTADRVRMIKKKMLGGKTRLKIIAKQFGVSDMQIHRIKTGENWGHVMV